MPTWAWITIAVVVDAIFWSFIVQRTRKQLKGTLNMHLYFTSRLSAALQAAKGQRGQLLEGLQRDMAIHGEAMETWRG
jgi:hypothetical protein